jgi:hypothetical protein
LQIASNFLAADAAGDDTGCWRLRCWLAAPRSKAIGSTDLSITEPIADADLSGVLHVEGHAV